MLSMTLWLLSVLVPLQIFIGDLHGLNTLEHQPAKLAAIEAHWGTASRVPLTLFAVPDESDETNRYSVEIPVLGSPVLTHDPNGVVRGLKDWPRADRPPVAIPFFAFRIMVGIGLIMWASSRRAAGCGSRDVSSTRHGFSGRASSWPRSASSPCWQGGPPPRWDASPGLFMACSARRIRSPRR